MKGKTKENQIKQPENDRKTQRIIFFNTSTKFKDIYTFQYLKS